jgi:hypothetical protein
MNRMPRIDRHSVDADGVVKAAMLEAFLAALVAVRTQRLQGASPELHWIVVISSTWSAMRAATILPSLRHISHSGSR